MSRAACESRVQPGTKEAVEQSLAGLSRYMSREGEASYDPHDVMSTALGRAVRKGYYGKRRLFYAPAAAVLCGLDAVAPRLGRLRCEPTVSAEATAYIARARLDMYLTYRDVGQLAEAERLLDWLRNNSIDGYSGACWGLPFDWQTTSGLVPRDTPCVTVTSTVALLMLDAAEMTKKRHYLDLARSACDFVMNDLNRKGGVLSYTPLDETYVVNANAYAADLLLEVGKATKTPVMLGIGREILARVLREQREDGSWPYFFSLACEQHANFIDCLHTCFVIECLMRIHERGPGAWTRGSAERGARFLADNFIGKDGSCRHYLTYHSPHLIRADARSCAEAIRCLCIVDDIVPGSRRIAERVALWTIRRMQLRDGSFRHRLFALPTAAASYNRWSNGPMLAALALLDRKLTEELGSGEGAERAPRVAEVKSA